jgi:hypothetical protein
MKTLKDYELIRGDWVEFHSYGWREFRGKANELHCFYDSEYDAPDGAFVNAVLRPKIILRDILDDKLRMARQYLAEGLLPTSFVKSYSFELILPKEEKKSLFDEIFKGRYRTDFSEDLKKFIKPICDEIDKLKNKENE